MSETSNSSGTAIQICLQSMRFDRATTFTMKGFVIGLTQRNIDGDGQLYVSNAPFQVRRDGKAKTKDDEVYTWQGDGEVVFSTALDEDLDRIGLELYFVRDNRGIREIGGILQELLADEGELGQELAKVLESAASSAGGAAGQIIHLVRPAVRFVGKLLANKKDKVKIRADGSMLTSTLRGQLAADTSDRRCLSIPWGVRTSPDGKYCADADKGYFMTRWAFVESESPEAQVVVPQLPKDLRARLSA
jgi:hypothetical protein